MPRSGMRPVMNAGSVGCVSRGEPRKSPAVLTLRPGLTAPERDPGKDRGLPFLEFLRSGESDAGLGNYKRLGHPAATCLPDS